MKKIIFTSILIFILGAVSACSHSEIKKPQNIDIPSSPSNPIGDNISSTPSKR